MDTVATQNLVANADRLDGFVHKFVKNAWYVAAQAREVEHMPLGRRILEQPILLYRTIAGKVVALHDVCPHRFMPMSKGRLVKDSIRCTYHGSLFDENGACVEIPSQESIPPKCFLRSYPVVERQKWVWIWMGDPAKADTSLIPHESYLGFGHENYSTVEHKYRLVKGRYGLCNENLIDDTHISFLHLGQFESGGRVHTMPEVSEEGPWIKSRWYDQHEKISPFFRMLFDVDYDIAPRALVGHFHPPATHVVWIEMYNPKAPEEKPRVLRVALAFTPETATTTHWFWAESRNFHQGHAAWDAFATDTSWAIQDQDFFAIEAIEALLQQNTQLPEEVSFKADAGIMRARRVMNQIIRDEAAGLEAGQ
jgi:vanillate O-demethylase monooxygenase subunit